MDNIKLIIWDLDETFWSGTLSDGEVTPITKNINLVKQLTDRGIVNSICSKNDFEKASAVLKTERFSNIYDYFVFPSIDWTGKGVRIKQLISDMNLRPVNVLFVDDNKTNLNEAKFECPNINTVLYNDLYDLINTNTENFIGKNDTNHSRLNQYKILQTKVTEKKHAKSNDEFLISSNITVQMIESNLDYDRIHEMIHRNNQLNFTKDRISLEKVKDIFSSPNIRSGIVHVTDKYGDHGIVGCYALSNGKLIQFVFSCRILGMGVEQYVYQQLLWPDIDIIGEVASQLVKGEKITYINCGMTSCETNDILHSEPKLIAYGFCPLKPIWAYLEPKLKTAVFNAISPDPSTLNLGVLFSYSKDFLNSIVNNVRMFHTKYTFDENILNSKLDYLLITLSMESRFYKYSNKNGTGEHFYSGKLHNDSINEQFSANYEETEITIDDIYNEMSVLLNNLEKHVTVVMVTVPEVEFKVRGKDKDYFWRIELNKVTEKLATEHSNLKLIDMRKYAKADSDFFDPVPNHYNRSIGFALANDILTLMNVNKTDECTSVVAKNNKCLDVIPKNALRKTETLKSGKNITSLFYIVNGQIHFSIDGVSSKEADIDITLHKDRLNVYQEHGACDFSINVPGIGCYFVTYSIHEISDNADHVVFHTNKIDYNEFNYISYIDPCAKNYYNYVGGINEFYRDNHRRHNKMHQQLEQIIELSAHGVTIADYFRNRGITQVNLFFSDIPQGKTILSQLLNSEIQVNRVYTTAKWYSYTTSDGRHTVKIHDVNSKLSLNKDEHLLFCHHKGILSKEHSIVSKYGYKIHYVDTVVAELMTQTFCFPYNKGSETSNQPMVIAVRSGYLLGALGFDRNAYTKDEKIISSFTVDSARECLLNGRTSELSKTFNNLPADILRETLIKPKEQIDSNGLPVLEDTCGKYLNIKNGFRITTDSPSSYVGTIYVCGDIRVFGTGSPDNETICSYLQRMIDLPFRVVNYSNFVWISNWDRQLELLRKTKFHKNDIVVLLITNSGALYENQWEHWLHWDGFKSPVIKVDAFPMFYRKNRPEYFLLYNAYTSECNHDLAQLINDSIHQNISKLELGNQ